MLNAALAREVYEILVDDAGAAPWHADDCVRYLTDDTIPGHEWRFQGVLGFGGKLHYNWYRGAYITCYPEDQSEGTIATRSRRATPFGRPAVTHEHVRDVYMVLRGFEHLGKAHQRNGWWTR